MVHRIEHPNLQKKFAEQSHKLLKTITNVNTQGGGVNNFPIFAKERQTPRRYATLKWQEMTTSLKSSMTAVFSAT